MKISIRDSVNLCRSFSVFILKLVDVVVILSTCDLFELTVSHNRFKKKWFFLIKSLVESKQVFRFYYDCIYMNDFLSIVLIY